MSQTQGPLYLGRDDPDVTVPVSVAHVESRNANNLSSRMDNYQYLPVHSYRSVLHTRRVLHSYLTTFMSAVSWLTQYKKMPMSSCADN